MVVSMPGGKQETADPSDIPQILKELRELKVSFDAKLDDKFSELQSSIGPLTNRVAAAETEIVSNKQEIQNLNAVVAKLQEDLAKNSKELEEVKAQQNSNNATTTHLSDYSRRNNLEIHGYPESKTEDLKEVFVNLSKRLGLNPAIKTDNIDAIHRLPSKLSPKPIIVKFTNRWIRDKLWHAKSKQTILASELGFPDSTARVYINENLSPPKRYLAMRTRLEFKSKTCSVWTDKGRIFVSKKRKTPPEGQLEATGEQEGEVERNKIYNITSLNDFPLKTDLAKDSGEKAEVSA